MSATAELELLSSLLETPRYWSFNFLTAQGKGRRIYTQLTVKPRLAVKMSEDQDLMARISQLAGTRFVGCVSLFR
jgi:hypothetical protein